VRGGGRGIPSPRVATCYYFFFAFFAAFFFAFFFAAIIVSFKVNLGMLYVRVKQLLRTPIARFFERCVSVSSIVLPKNSGKTVRGAPILCYSSKKKQQLRQTRLTMEYRIVCLVQHFDRMKSVNEY
jgi:hypothetical protein